MKNTDIFGYFGFTRTPFTKEVQVEQQFTIPTFDQAIRDLKHAMEQRTCAALLAPAGAGKTAIVRKLKNQLPEARYRIHYVKSSNLCKRDMYRQICMSLGIADSGCTPLLVRRIEDFMLQANSSQGLRPVLIFDDAHEIRPDVLGILKVLTNYEMDSRLVVSILLVAHPCLKKVFNRTELDDVVSRLNHVATLPLLSREECRAYITHRCVLAGVRQVPFDENAFETVFEHTRGNMRAIDRLVLKSFEIAAFKDSQSIDGDHVLKARSYLP